MPEKNELLSSEKVVKVALQDITQDTEAATGQSSKQATQFEQEIMDTLKFHIVSRGENLYRISLLYNIKMQRLIDWNGLTDASAIFDGKKLFLVAPSVVE